MRENMKKTAYKLLRLTFVMTLAAAALFVSGGKTPSLEKTTAEKNRIQTAVTIVHGTVSETAKWQTCASINPMYFIEIETGNL